MSETTSEIVVSSVFITTVYSKNIIYNIIRFVPRLELYEVLIPILVGRPNTTGCG